MQLYKQWAIVVTLVILKFERKHTQEEHFTSVQWYRCFSYAHALLAVRAVWGYESYCKEVLLWMYLCLHLKVHHLRTSTGRFGA